MNSHERKLKETGWLSPTPPPPPPPYARPYKNGVSNALGPIPRERRSTIAFVRVSHVIISVRVSCSNDTNNGLEFRRALYFSVTASKKLMYNLGPGTSGCAKDL